MNGFTGKTRDFSDCILEMETQFYLVFEEEVKIKRGIHKKFYDFLANNVRNNGHLPSQDEQCEKLKELMRAYYGEMCRAALNMLDLVNETQMKETAIHWMGL